MTNPIAVLGSGPSGLLSAYAASFSGREIAIFSNRGASRIGGAQYLHRSIPGLTPEKPDAMIEYRVEGDPFTYQAKAYEQGLIPPFVSFERVRDGMQVPAWNLRDLYDQMWDKLEKYVTHQVVTAEWIKENYPKFELIISSIPKPAICLEPEHHYFRKQTIRIYNECILERSGDNVIYYDGTKNKSWYRASNLFGTGSTEWGSHVKVPYPNLVNVDKPIGTNCDCWYDRTNLVQVGRFGRWLKGILTHHAFEDTFNNLGSRQLLDGKFMP
jgi:hypothetical protein